MLFTRRQSNRATADEHLGKTSTVIGFPHDRRIAYDLARARADELRGELHRCLRATEHTADAGDAVIATATMTQLVERLIDAEREETAASEALKEWQRSAPP